MTVHIPCPDEAAEGDCDGVPYNTQLVSSRGVTIHFWLPEAESGARATELRKIALRHRDIVGTTWSYGQPEGYWAHEDIGP